MCDNSGAFCILWLHAYIRQKQSGAPVLSIQALPAGSRINFNGSLQRSTSAVLANAKNASRLLVAVRIHAPGASNTIARGVAEGRGAKKNSRHTLPIKKPPCSRGCTGVTLQCGRKSTHGRKHFFAQPVLPRRPRVSFPRELPTASRARVFHCTVYFRCNRIWPGALTLIYKIFAATPVR
jgi:hypothetical protein